MAGKKLIFQAQPEATGATMRTVFGEVRGWLEALSENCATLHGISGK